MTKVQFQTAAASRAIRSPAGQVHPSTTKKSSIASRQIRDHRSLAVSAGLSRRKILVTGMFSCALFSEVRKPADAIEITVVEDDVFGVRDDVMQSSFQKVDLAEMRKKQLDNLSKRGTDEYDDTCKVEESCLDKPKDLGEAVGRMFEIMNDSEMGFSSAEKMQKMGRDSTRPNVKQ